jgi:hypothetical protein
VGALPGAGGSAFAMTALASKAASTTISCAQTGTSGDGCARSASLTPTYFDLRVQSENVDTAQLPTSTTALTVTCDADTSAGATAPLPTPLAAKCGGTVTYDDDSSTALDAQDFSTAAPIRSVITLCASDSTAANCTLKVKAAPRTIKSITLAISDAPALDNATANNSRTIYTAISTTSCTDQPISYARTLNGANPIATPNYDVAMNPGDVLAIEIIDGVGIPKFPDYPTYPGLGIYWGSRDAQGARDISISKCKGDFGPSSQIVTTYDSPFAPNGAAYFYFVSPTETAQPRQDYPYYTVRQNTGGRWYINIRHRGCLPMGTGFDRCTIFYSVG